MRKNLILLPLVGALLYLVLSSYSSGPGAGGLGDLTGAHGTAGCSCHNGSSTSTTTIAIELDSAGIQVFKYTGGNSYTIKLTGTQTSGTLTLPRFGFQLGVVGTGGTTSRGTMTAISGTHLGTYGGISVLEQGGAMLATSGIGGAGTTYVVNIPWVAPSAGTGCVTIFSTLMAVNFSGGADAGDKWNNGSYTIAENVANITGATTVCVGTTTTLSDATTCGSWSSSSTSVATIGSASGVVTGVAAGTTVITYAANSNNFATTIVTVNAAPPVPTGTLGMCIGGAVTLTDAGGAGTWSSGNLSVATVGSTTGVVSGIAAGTARITFTQTSSGCFSTNTVTVNSSPPAITGSTTACIGATGFLSNSLTGGTWSSSNTAVATGGTTGVTAVGAGTATISYTLSTGCAASISITVNPVPPTITGSTNACVGFTSILSDATSGGTWSSSSSSIASASAGVVNGIAPGTAIITYTVPGAGCITTTLFTVNPTPPGITGPFTVCPGTSITLSDATSGGTWSSPGTSAILTVGATTGEITGVAAGTANITYTLPTGCFTTTPIIAYGLPAPITGTPVVCVGANAALSNADAGGTWISTNTAIALVDASIGTLTGVAAGTTTISYLLTTGCITTTTALVNPQPASITGTANLCVGSSQTLADATTGGTWSTSNAATAIIGSSSGIVTGVASGLVTITYRLASTGCYNTANQTINALPGAISGASSLCVGATTNLTDGGGGTWSSSTTSVATIGTTTGVVTGVSAGTTTITFRATSTGCIATTIETINPVPTAITGMGTLCAGGGTLTLSDGVAGGTWLSSNANASVGSTTGILTGVTAGNSIITYKLPTGCQVTQSVTVSPIPAAIAGSVNVCLGSSATLTDATTGGTWSSNNTSVATIVATTGLYSGISVGTSTISYALASGCASTTVVNVNALPSAISGPASVCAGQTITLSNTTTGGTWSSGNAVVATVGSTTGIVSGIAAGTATISYRLPAGCFITMVVRVNPFSNITGLTSMCSGLTTTLSNATTGGTWSSSNTAVATVGLTSGVVTGTGAGTSTISYTLASGCNSSIVMNIVSGPGPITGSTNVCLGSTSTLVDAGGGTWTSSNTTRATIGSLSGIVTGIANGTSIITYSLGTGCAVTIIVTVNPVPPTITGPNSLCVGQYATYHDFLPGGTWSCSAGFTIDVSGLATGVSAGIATVTYSTSTGCYATKNVTVNPVPTAIGGPISVCVGSTVTLTDSMPGGTWSSSLAGIASIGATTGILAGVSTGTTIVSYILPTGCNTTLLFTVNPLPSAISGTASVCAGANTTLTDASSGGTWSSSNANASVDPFTGVVTGVTNGTSVITYTLASGCFATRVELVNALPSVFTVTGGGAYCAGGTGVHVGLSGSTSGIQYQLYIDTSFYSGGSATGTGIALDFGAMTITGTYTVLATNTATGCKSGMSGSAVITVNPLPSAITGTLSLCAGASTTLADASTGGTWSASGTHATIDTFTGVVSGVSSGVASITYTLATGCSTTTVVTVNPVPGAITGDTTVCIGATTTLTNSLTGGTWSSSSSATATIGSITGLVTGVGAGTTIISYTMSTGCSTSRGMWVNPTPSAITGTTTLCAGLTSTLSDAISGGNWSSSNTAVANIGSTTGVMTGVASGSATVSYTLGTGCYATAHITVNPLPASIGGASSVCAGSTVTLTDATTGGSWSSSDITVATIGSTTGVVSGISAGAVNLTYTLGTGCMITRSLTVNPLPASIGGPTSVCPSLTITLTDASTGGTWSTTNTLGVTVGSSSGVVTSGTSAGTLTITYTLPTGCKITSIVTVNPAPNAGVISGPDSVCMGSTVTLTESVAGGEWSSGNTAIATIGSTSGVVTPVSAGITSMIYTVTNICGSADTSIIFMVIALPFADTLVGNDSVCEGDTVHLSDIITSGVWTSSNTGVATVTAAGIVTGVAAGTAVISYTVTTPCGSGTGRWNFRVKSHAECNVGVATTPIAGALSIYPNPSGGLVTLELPLNVNNSEIIVTDVMGKVVEHRNVTNTTHVSLDLGNNASGTYFIKVIAAGTTYRQKVELVK